jgi:mannose-6-phosphate isomerase-like protein (cupin superfamily)
MPLIDNSQAPAAAMHGVTFTAIASPSRGSSENAVWRALVAPKAPGVLHHMTREEIILAVAGQGTIRIDDDLHTLSPGDAFAVPAFTDFRLECAGDTPFEAIVVLPAGGRGVIAGESSSFTPPWSI